MNWVDCYIWLLNKRQPLVTPVTSGCSGRVWNKKPKLIFSIKQADCAVHYLFILFKQRLLGKKQKPLQENFPLLPEFNWFHQLSGPIRAMMRCPICCCCCVASLQAQTLPDYDILIWCFFPFLFSPFFPRLDTLRLLLKRQAIQVHYITLVCQAAVQPGSAHSDCAPWNVTYKRTTADVADNTIKVAVSRWESWAN